MNFEMFKLHAKIAGGVNAAGYTSPTAIQLESIPPIMDGRDVMGLAQTGTGKTAAFVLPILHRLLPGPRKIIRALILAPTRELTEQTHEAIGLLGRKTGLRSASIYGGVSILSQIQALRKGVDIISACPGRLLDHINRKTINLSTIEVVVIDEADRMFDMGFLPDVRKIIKRLPVNRQTLLFSATMPDDIQGLAREILRDPVKVQIGRTAPASTVAHTFYPVETQDKIALLNKILESTETGPVLVFTRTKIRSSRVARQLEISGYNAAALHGNLSQNKRQEAIDGFRSGRYKILVATDVAARGIDVRGISHVINFDFPDTLDAYTHRIGRTGRACETGDAFTFVTGEDRGPAHAIIHVLGSKLKYCKLQGFECAADTKNRPSLPGSQRVKGDHFGAAVTVWPRSRPKGKFRPLRSSQRHSSDG